MWEVFITILAGVSVFVLGQLVIKFFIEPMYEIRMVLGRIVHATTYYLNAADLPMLRAVPPDAIGFQAYRDLAAELEQRVYAMPGYRFWTRAPVLRVPPRENVSEAIATLMGLPNSMTDDDRIESLGKVRALLKLPALPSKPEVDVRTVLAFTESLQGVDTTPNDSQGVASVSEPQKSFWRRVFGG